VDVDKVRADPSAEFRLPLGKVLRAGDEIVTYVSRNLEPLRGYHVFMRALPRILQERPEAHVVIVGGDQVSYGALPPSGTTWKALYFNEIAGQIDRRRIHFLGHTSYQTYLKLLQISAVHVYLTYPFVLSWSLLEAMSTECNIVASDTPPVRELLDNDSAVLVPFFDHDALAAEVVDILRDPQSFRKRAQHARAKVVASYDAKRICVPKLRAFLNGNHA
jgi:glycosyltransferase involved in cell wall biosynthesis